jgi:hypothetical protein
MSLVHGRIAIVSLLVWLFPRISAACSVCYGGDEESRTAFILTTVFLSVLPLAMIGSLVWWLWRAASRAEREREARPVALPGLSDPTGLGR